MTTARERAERILRHAPIMATAKEAVLVMIEVEIEEAEQELAQLRTRVAELEGERDRLREALGYAAMDISILIGDCGVDSSVRLTLQGLEKGIQATLKRDE